MRWNVFRLNGVHLHFRDDAIETVYYGLHFKVTVNFQLSTDVY